MTSLVGFVTPPAIPAGLPSDTVAANVIVAGARTMDAEALANATREAYHNLRRQLQAAGGEHIWRVWNYVPALLSSAGPGVNRYMAFNVGRHAAMSTWFGENLAALAPAGTGVGSPGADLVIHAIAGPMPGKAVANPRQTAPVDYSARYGPRPPCFARATRVGNVLLVSGTAAITGEDTVAPDDLARQLALTLDHLAALAGGLNAYRSLRAYVPRSGDAVFVATELSKRLPHVAPVSPIVTDLCRRELLVEIEGVAEDSNGL